MPLDKLTKEAHGLMVSEAGPRVARYTVWLWIAVAWAVGLGVLGAFAVLVSKNLVQPAISMLPSVPFPEVVNVLVSGVLTAGAIGLASSRLMKRFRESQAGMMNTMSVFVKILDYRIQKLEVHAASVPSVNSALTELHERLTPLEHLPAGVLKDKLAHDDWAMTKLLDTPRAHGVGHPLTIQHATYGAESGATGPQREVVSVLKSHIKDNRLQMKISNETMGGDPHRGFEKRVQVIYSYGPYTKEVRVPEGEELRIPDTNLLNRDPAPPHIDVSLKNT